MTESLGPEGQCGLELYAVEAMVTTAFWSNTKVKKCQAVSSTGCFLCRVLQTEYLLHIVMASLSGQIGTSKVGTLPGPSWNIPGLLPMLEAHSK